MRCPPHCLAQANGLKLKDFLANEVVAEFLLSDSVALLTFKAERTGANITTDQAKLNSDEWFMTEIVNSNAAIEAIPSSDAFDTESVERGRVGAIGGRFVGISCRLPAFVWPWPWPWP